MPLKSWFQAAPLSVVRSKMHLFSRSFSHSLLFRQQRLAEMKAAQMKNKFGEVLEISGKDYVQEVTKAGKGIWVVLHLYKQG